VQGEAEAEIVPDHLQGRARQRGSPLQTSVAIIGKSINTHEPGATAPQPVRPCGIPRGGAGMGQGVAGPGQAGGIRAHTNKSILLKLLG